MPGSAVTLQWPALVFGSGGPHTETQTLRATTTREGWFAICGLHEDDYALHAEKGARATGLIEVAVRPHDVARLSLLLGGGAPAPERGSVAGGGAALSGIVRSSDGHPLEGAQVAVDGSAAIATTDARGAFALSGIPNGTRMAEARALGYEPTRVRVEPSRTEPRTVTIAMKKRVATLNEVTVFGRRTQRMRDLTGFAERRQRGFGRFMTREEIGERNVLSACDLLRHFAGVIVIDDGMMGCKVNIRGATSGASPVGMGAVPNLCQPTLYQDNVPYNGSLSELAHTVSPRDIMGIEVYTSATEPPQFPGLCGAIVVWTRTGA